MGRGGHDMSWMDPAVYIEKRCHNRDYRMPSLDPASQLSMLREITGRLAAGQRLEDVLITITRVLVERAGLRSVAIWLYLFDEECENCRDLPVTDPPNGRRLHRVARSTNPPVTAYDHLHTLPLSEATADRLSRESPPIWHNDLLELGQMVSAGTGGGSSPQTAEEWAATAAAEGIHAGALFPLFVGEDLTGFMFLMTDRAIEERDVRYLEIFALQAASIIRSARLYLEIERLRDHLALENAYLEEAVRAEAGFAEIVGTSPVLGDVLRLIRQVAPTDSTVLLCGETGTGKELVARAIHGASRRADHPIIKVNCGGLSPGLVDSELFGHERGAFTGATQRRIGRFELADRGTLFLDEVAELPDGDPGEAAASAAGAGVRAGGRRADASGGCQTDRRDPPGSRRGGRGGALPLRPLLPPQRLPHRHSAAAGAPGGHRPAGAAFRRPLRPPAGEAADRDLARELRAAEPLRLAGEHPRTAERDRAGRASSPAGRWWMSRSRRSERREPRHGIRQRSKTPSGPTFSGRWSAPDGGWRERAERPGSSACVRARCARGCRSSGSSGRTGGIRRSGRESPRRHGGHGGLRVQETISLIPRGTRSSW